MSNDGFNFDDERAQTNTELAGKLQRLQALTSADIAELVPDLGDRAEIQRVIDAVNAASNHNRKVAVLQQNLAAGGGALANLIGRLT
jgi:hypothetical protein